MNSKTSSRTQASGPSQASTGYAKGEQTRTRILAVALEVFGSRGFDGSTTREIVEQAGVNLPALKYYFGGKGQLYLACAQYIVRDYGDRVGAIAAPALEALKTDASREEYAAHLKQIMSALCKYLLLSDKALNRTLFISREMTSPGPAFELLYSELWNPGTLLVSALVERTSGGAVHSDEALIRAMMMLSSITGLAMGRNVVARGILKGDMTELVRHNLDLQIDQLLHL